MMLQDCSLMTICHGKSLVQAQMIAIVREVVDVVHLYILIITGIDGLLNPTRPITGSINVVNTEFLIDTIFYTTMVWSG